MLPDGGDVIDRERSDYHKCLRRLEVVEDC